MYACARAYTEIRLARETTLALCPSPVSSGCELWGFHEDKDLERVEDHYLKFVLYLPPNATTAAIRGELGQLPIHLLWKERILRYWNRLCSEDTPVLLRHAILHLKHLLEKGKQCWLTEVQAIFEGAGFASAFTYNGCDKELTNLIMLRYRDQYIQSWYQKLHRTTSTRGCGGNKLRTYQLFKSKFEQEPYLSIVANVKHRVALTRLRLSCHRLEIEVGRYHKPTPTPVPLRLCRRCQMVEDEIHFIYVCPRFSTLCQELFAMVHAYYPPFQWLSTTDKFIYLLTSTNVHILRELSAFVYKSFKLHSCTTASQISHPGFRCQ